MKRPDASQPPDDASAAEEAAADAGLRYVSDQDPGIHRRGAGKAFRFIDATGKPVTDKAVLARIRSLAIPPAYTDVWICRQANGHIQATGRDARGRKQYRYHPRFREARDSTKYEHMLDFAAALPKLRKAIDRDLRRQGLPREKILATVVYLLENTMIRVGGEEYARDNKSYGLTTLRNRHVDIDGSALRFEFKGKSGKSWQVSIDDRRVAKIVKATQDLPGQRLFQYVGEDGERQDVTSGDVNAYLRDISGEDITAKDFRTWAGTILATLALAAFDEADSEATAKANIKDAVERVADALGNTPTICRKCYIHPEVFAAYLDKEISIDLDAGGSSKAAKLRPEESAVLALLKRRLREKRPVQKTKRAAPKDRPSRSVRA